MPMMAARISRRGLGSGRGPVATAALALALAAAVLAQASCRSRSRLPAQLTDDEFWTLTSELSEPAGAFPHSDNLVSNELQYAQTMYTLGPTGGVYIGVGPEQNFSFISRLRPRMAFVVDIRSDNRGLHLLYKALFEISANRRDFVSRLFSRALPPQPGDGVSAAELFDRFAKMPRQPALRDETLQLVLARLLEHHAFALTTEDLQAISYALDSFYADGPDIHYGRLHPTEQPGPSYRALMAATDVMGDGHSYLWSDENFAFVKDLQMRNLIVPLVGDFGGPTALRRTGDYVRQHGEVISAFYASNVEVYLNRDKAAMFCATLSALPYNWATWFIGSRGKQPLRVKLAACSGKDTLKLPPR
jgi:hypothetical protein